MVIRMDLIKKILLEGLKEWLRYAVSGLATLLGYVGTTFNINTGEISTDPAIVRIMVLSFIVTATIRALDKIKWYWEKENNELKPKGIIPF